MSDRMRDKFPLVLSALSMIKPHFSRIALQIWLVAGNWGGDGGLVGRSGEGASQLRKGVTLGASQRLCADAWDGLGSPGDAQIADGQRENGSAVRSENRNAQNAYVFDRILDLHLCPLPSLTSSVARSRVKGRHTQLVGTSQTDQARRAGLSCPGSLTGGATWSVGEESPGPAPASWAGRGFTSSGKVSVLRGLGHSSVFSSESRRYERKGLNWSGFSNEMDQQGVLR
ncbi:unnamed protein product [Rangifer tarandus platyrhynchus]|uniref:Uncharacterized protein n=1 Tax=Rangifer tarandus platyrhynchus TaxID=3082113 RepID=A0ABN8ZNI4_RANTA|nr:unnamed protein product [Rangifer tarandus platyrhynchus]